MGELKRVTLSRERLIFFCLEKNDCPRGRREDDLYSFEDAWEQKESDQQARSNGELIREDLQSSVPMDCCVK